MSEPAATGELDLRALRRAVVMGLVEGRGRDGAPIHERFADSYSFEDGLVRDRTTYFFRHGF